MKKSLIILVIFSVLSSCVMAQELNCNVTINSDKIEGSSKEVYETLKQSIAEFINSNKWTNLNFQPQERIDCNLLIVISAVTDNEYACEATIQASRPVFNTSYTTPLLNVKDKAFAFTYQPYDQLVYQQNTFQTNLAALLSYYVYLILGIDADSYQRLGGTPYFQVCENIVNVAQTATLSEAEGAGWKFARSSRSRYTIVNELIDEAFKPYRSFFYEYHRMGLDEMQANVANGRARIASGLESLKETNKNRPTNTTIPMFLDAKSDELVNIFSGGTDAEKRSVSELLTNIDPTRSSTYERITQER